MQKRRKPRLGEAGLSGGSEGGQPALHISKTLEPPFEFKSKSRNNCVSDSSGLMRDLDHGRSGWRVVLLSHGNIPVSKCRDLSSLRFEQKAPHFLDPVCGAFAICGASPVIRDEYG